MPDMEWLDERGGLQSIKHAAKGFSNVSQLHVDIDVKQKGGRMPGMEWLDERGGLHSIKHAAKSFSDLSQLHVNL